MAGLTLPSIAIRKLDGRREGGHDEIGMVGPSTAELCQNGGEKFEILYSNSVRA
jgi:hypothetical protein